MDQDRHGVERRLSSASLRHALRWGTRLVLVPSVCALWIGLVAPGLQLLPGVGSVTDPSVAISLQSALLGIDDTGGPGSSLAVRAAERALGLNTGGGVLSASLLRTRLT